MNYRNFLVSQESDGYWVFDPKLNFLAIAQTIEDAHKLIDLEYGDGDENFTDDFISYSTGRVWQA